MMIHMIDELLRIRLPGSKVQLSMHLYITAYIIWRYTSFSSSFDASENYT